MSNIRESGSPFERASTTPVRKKFATQMDERLLADLRSYAKKDGRQLQAVLEDAVRSYLKEQSTYKMPDDVRAAYENTLRRFPKTLEILAK